MPQSTKTKLVSTRVSREIWDVLQVAAVVEGAETQQALLKPVIEDYAERMRQEPEVRAMLEETEKYRARKSPVTDIGPAHKRRKQEG
jgi:hypothetical protein